MPRIITRPPLAPVGVYTSGELSLILGCSVHQIIRMANRGELSCFQIPGSQHRRFYHETLVEHYTAMEDAGALERLERAKRWSQARAEQTQRLAEAR